MSVVEVFHDTNVLLYLMSADTAKADRAEALLARGGCISVQVLNEFASVASRKLAMPWSEIEETLAGLPASPLATLEDVLAADARARVRANQIVMRLKAHAA